MVLTCYKVFLLYDRTGADPGTSGGDDMDEEKIGRGLGAAVGPQRGPGAEPLVGVKGEAPYKSNAFFTSYTVILHFLNSAVR
jgi:hypothetical protein